MYMNKELLMERAANKIKTLAESDINAMQSREKAIHSMELERLYNNLSPYRAGSELAGQIADDCMQMKVKLIESERPSVDNTRQRRAKVIMEGMNNTSYNVPWLNQ